MQGDQGYLTVKEVSEGQRIGAKGIWREEGESKCLEVALEAKAELSKQGANPSSAFADQVFAELEKLRIGAASQSEGSARKPGRRGL